MSPQEHAELLAAVKGVVARLQALPVAPPPSEQVSALQRELRIAREQARTAGNLASMLAVRCEEVREQLLQALEQPRVLPDRWAPLLRRLADRLKP